MRKIKVISYSLTLGIMALIFFFSSQTREESSALSNGFILHILRYVPVFSPMTEAYKLELAQNLSFIVRKTAHFTIYASLGASAVLSIRLLIGKCYKITALYTACFCAAYAISDELHQMFVSGRGAQLRDVCVDTLGAVTGIFIFLLIRKLMKTVLNNRGVTRR